MSDSVRIIPAQPGTVAIVYEGVKGEGKRYSKRSVIAWFIDVYDGTDDEVYVKPIGVDGLIDNVSSVTVGE